MLGEAARLNGSGSSYQVEGRENRKIDVQGGWRHSSMVSDLLVRRGLPRSRRRGWLRQADTYIQNTPSIRLVAYWNAYGAVECDRRIDSSDASRNAWQAEFGHNASYTGSTP